MGKMSKVTNMRNETYDQVVNGVHYVIKPQETVLLDRYEAVNLVGHYCGQTKVNLKIEHSPDESAVKKPAQIFVAPDGKEFTQKEALMEYLNTKRGK